MRTKKVTRYYCDFCSTGKFTRPAMAHHEARCTNNPNRECGMCPGKRNYKFEVELWLESLSKSQNQKQTFLWLKNRIECPACILTVLRLSKTAVAFTTQFQFKEELLAWNEKAGEREFYAEQATAEQL